MGQGKTMGEGKANKQTNARERKTKRMLFVLAYIEVDISSKATVLMGDEINETIAKIN